MSSSPATGIDWDGLTAARRALIGNPYQVTEDHLAAVEAWFFKRFESVPAAMANLCEQDLAGDARKLVLAGAHYAARSDAKGESAGGRLCHLLLTLERGVDASRPLGLRIEVAELRRIVWALHRFYSAEKKLIGASSPMRRLKETLWTACFGPSLFLTLERQLAIRQQNILLLGEPGTGKEVVANVILNAALTDGPDVPRFQSLNCAAIPNDLAEAELFGSEKGAYTGATARREGKLVAANGGTLFLDEVADLPRGIQAKLLSVLANGKVTPVGGNHTQQVQVRYVSATSRPLPSMVQDGTFRDDLYGRLAHTVVELPPLRERREDIEAIGKALHRKLAPPRVANPEGESSKIALHDMVFDAWLREEAAKRPWAGNVRELEAAIREYVLGFRERRVLATISTPKVQVSPASRAPVPTPSQPTHSQSVADLLALIPQKIIDCTATDEEVGAWYLKRVLKHTHGNQSKARKILGIDRGTVRRRLVKLDIAEEPGEASGKA